MVGGRSEAGRGAGLHHRTDLGRGSGIGVATVQRSAGCGCVGAGVATGGQYEGEADVMQADAVCTSGSYQMQRIKKGRRDVPAGLHWRIGLDKSKLFPVG